MMKMTNWHKQNGLKVKVNRLVDPQRSPSRNIEIGMASVS